MKITALKPKIVQVPIRYPVISCVRQSRSIMFVLLDVETDEGITGISYVQAFHAHGAYAIVHCLKHLETIVAGEDAENIEAIGQLMTDAMKLLGLQGLPMFALSLVDIALWDIKGKSRNLSICRLLGGEPDTIEAYQSDGLWLVPPIEAAKQAETFAQNGFASMKMRFGRKDCEEDLKAAQEIRIAIGERIELTGDVNQGWTADSAIVMARRLADCGLGWLEEPVEAEDLEAHAQLSMKQPIPVATGENLYGIRSMHRFLQANAATVYTPDLQRIGGITGWLKIRTMIEEYGKPSGLHLFPEYAVHLFPLIGRTVRLEWMSWASVLFSQPLECRQGGVRTPDRPGFGMEWDAQAIEAYRVG